MVTENIIKLTLRIVKLGIGCALFLACSAPPPPPPEPIVELPPPPPPPVEHTIQYSGETLGLIARWYTGKATNWEAIQAANPSLNPRRMNLGTVITIPRELIVKEEAMPRSFVGSRATSAAAKTRSGATGSAAGSSSQPSIDATGVEDRLSAEERLRRDLEAALATEVGESGSGAGSGSGPGSGSSAATTKTQEPTAVEPGSGGSGSGSAAEDVDRERLLDELLAE